MNEVLPPFDVRANGRTVFSFDDEMTACRWAFRLIRRGCRQTMVFCANWPNAIDIYERAA